MKMLPPTFALFALLVALPADAQVTVARARDFGFRANWGLNEACPDPAEGGRLIGAELSFAESALSGGSQFPMAFLGLHYGNDCSPDPLLLPFDATGTTSASTAQSYTIDKRPGAQGLSFATYRATIPLAVEATDCIILADVNVRLEGVAPIRTERSSFHSREDGTFSLQFTDSSKRPAQPSGSILVSDPLGCLDDRVPTEFAVHPQSLDPDTGDAVSFVFRTRELVVTRSGH